VLREPTLSRARSLRAALYLSKQVHVARFGVSPKEEGKPSEVLLAAFASGSF
jgi:hypothetical protein